MEHVLAALLALILKCLAAYEGSLSPPVNISVELLDFRAYVQWLPGPGSPAGTRYSLEFTDAANYSKPDWNQLAHCANITSTRCWLSLNHQHHYSQFFLRVKAEWRDKRSIWETTNSSFQPYSDNMLSPPHLIVSADHQSISINLSHPVQSVVDIKIQFRIDLYQISDIAAPKHIGQKTAVRTNFTHLPEGNYCINASAFYTSLPKPNRNITKCVSVRPGGNVWMWVVVGLSVFVLISACLAVMATYCHIRHHVKRIQTPNVLRIEKRRETDHILKHEQPAIHPISDPEICSSRHEDVNVEYWERLVFSARSAEEPEAVRFADEASDDLPVCPDLYTTAAELEEELDQYPSPERIFGYGSTDKPSNTKNSSVSDLHWVPGDTLERTYQSAELENLMNFKLEESKKVEEQIQNCLFSYRCEGDEAAEENADSLEFLGSCYEPRPDPRQMLSFKGC